MNNSHIEKCLRFPSGKYSCFYLELLLLAGEAVFQCESKEGNNDIYSSKQKSRIDQLRKIVIIV